MSINKLHFNNHNTIVCNNMNTKQQAMIRTEKFYENKLVCDLSLPDIVMEKKTPVRQISKLVGSWHIQDETSKLMYKTFCSELYDPNMRVSKSTFLTLKPFL